MIPSKLSQTFGTGSAELEFQGSKAPECSITFDKNEIRVKVISGNESVIFPANFALEFDLPGSHHWSVRPFSKTSDRSYMKQGQDGLYLRMSPHSEFQFKIMTDFSQLPA